jgi:hypothetical protein
MGALFQDRRADWTVGRNITLTLTCEFASWKPVSPARELQLAGASQRGQEPLDTEAGDATPLEAATKQRTEDRDWEHQPVCDSDLYSAATSCLRTQ